MNAIKLIEQAEEQLEGCFKRADAVERKVFSRVLKSFQDNMIGQRHFAGTTGYGYSDDGRDAFESIFAQIMGAEEALVRPSVASGTHALAVCLFGLLRPGDTLLYASGEPYDTLRGVIGTNGGGSGTLFDWGIKYKHIDLLDDGSIDMAKLEYELEQDKTIKLVAMQRSRGYSWRRTLSIAELGEAVKLVKATGNARVMIDNCYGEFVCEDEPCVTGADAVVGSLIKNPGGGIAPTGGYIAGSTEAVSLCAQRLTAPGVGKEIGSWQSGYRDFFQGLYAAPHAVNQAVKGAMLFAYVMEILGFDVSPSPHEERYDIIQAVKLGSADATVKFCRAVQASSPVDSYALPEPSHMPGYDSEVIMAAGAFVAGSSIELSADAPMREPYIVFVQGGVLYEQVRLAVEKVINELT